MKLALKNSFMFFVITLALLISALGVTPAFADDGTPPPPTEEPVSTDSVPAEVTQVVEQLPADTTLVVLDQSGEALPLASDEAAAVLAAPDPYFWVSGIVYEFTAADCDPDTVGDQPCPNPIQAAVDYLAYSLDATPDDNTIWVESGIYDEDIIIDGFIVVHQSWLRLSPAC